MSPRQGAQSLYRNATQAKIDPSDGFDVLAYFSFGDIRKQQPGWKNETDRNAGHGKPSSELVPLVSLCRTGPQRRDHGLIESLHLSASIRCRQLG